MSGVLADTGCGLIVCELHSADAEWSILGDVLDAGADPIVGLFDPTLLLNVRFSSYYALARLSEIAAIWEAR